MGFLLRPGKDDEEHQPPADPLEDSLPDLGAPCVAPPSPLPAHAALVDSDAEPVEGEPSQRDPEQEAVAPANEDPALGSYDGPALTSACECGLEEYCLENQSSITGHSSEHHILTYQIMEYGDEHEELVTEGIQDGEELDGENLLTPPRRSSVFGEPVSPINYLLESPPKFQLEPDNQLGLLSSPQSPSGKVEKANHADDDIEFVKHIPAKDESELSRDEILSRIMALFSPPGSMPPARTSVFFQQTFPILICMMYIYIYIMQYLKFIYLINGSLFVLISSILGSDPI